MNPPASHPAANHYTAQHPAGRRQRRDARLVGGLFLAAFACYGLGSALGADGLGPALLLANCVAAAHESALQVAMVGLGVGSLPFCVVLARAGVEPGWLAGWGLAGYAALVVGSLLQLGGVGAGLWLSAPGGLFEVALGVLLLARAAPTSLDAPEIADRQVLA